MDDWNIFRITGAVFCLFVLQTFSHLQLPTIWNAHSLPYIPGRGSGGGGGHDHLLENYKRFPYRAIITNVTESYSSGMLNCKLRFNTQNWFTFLKKCFAKGKKANLLNLKHYYFTIKRYWIHFNRSKRGKVNWKNNLLTSMEKQKMEVSWQVLL